jgi:hypothetical protein
MLGFSVGAPFDSRYNAILDGDDITCGDEKRPLALNL